MALGHDFWGVFTAREAQRVLVNDEDFLSGFGVFPWNGVHNPDPLRQSIVIASDGARREAVRGAMKDLFTRSAVQAMLAGLEQDLADLLTPHLGGRDFDFGAEIGWPMAMRTMTRITGVTGVHEEKLGPLVSGVLGDMRPDVEADRKRASEAYAEVATVLSEAVEQARGAPPDHLIGRLEGAREAGSVSRRDVLANLIATIVGGTEAPRLVLTAVAVLLAEQPSWLDALTANPALLPGFVEEALRWTSPTTMIGRTLARPLTLGGRRLAAGDTVRVMVAAVVRDPARYPDPDVFDPARPQRPLVFGHGPHHCIGAAFARVQVTTLVEFFLRHRLRPELLAPPVLSQSNAFVGPLSALVRLRPHPTGRTTS
ncbi:hydroxylation protein CepL [Crossiella equi]|uniref:Hydroxylation protein CepL n=1 Tax=Crossiella equi TaxID=130796 RepID=A0ABS5ASB3_9PSEU|nr:cytochrome P450 [Crossiella equi]MBP2479458.1 hydroxylation protein CepL [Crossiella equi]